MLRAIPDLPPGVIGFEAVGEVHADDYRDVLRPAIDAAVASGGVRLVYVLGPEFSGYSAGASWQDAKLGLDHMSSWERTAVVSDHAWVEHLVGALGWMVPGEVCRFALDERDDAVRWAAGTEPETAPEPQADAAAAAAAPVAEAAPSTPAAEATTGPVPTVGLGNAQTLTPTAPLAPGAYMRPGMASALPPQPAAPSVPEQWAPDPTGRHQYRWWDGREWTPHVADNGVSGFDPIS